MEVASIDHAHLSYNAGYYTSGTTHHLIIIYLIINSAKTNYIAQDLINEQ